MSRATESGAHLTTHSTLSIGATTETQHHELLKALEKSEKSDLIKCLEISSRKIRRKLIFLWIPSYVI